MSYSVLVTGGAGYIGAHTCLELLLSGYRVAVLDNLSKGSLVALGRVERLAGKPMDFIRGDVRDSARLAQVLGERAFDAVVHFAGLKAVGESNEIPLEYYDNNVAGSVALFGAMRRFGVKVLAFSSSATVYGDPVSLPLGEDSPCSATNPYGRTKLMVEHVLDDMYRSDTSWRIARLRYFNPVGAHESGLIGEDPRGTPNNLMPYICQVAGGRRERLAVFGADYPTVDGTGVRDYIHVVDLARGHVAALEYLLRSSTGLSEAFNLGTGRGASVLEVIRAFESASQQRVSYVISKRRPGDVAACWADPARAHELLGWRAERSLHQMCVDAWNWQAQNPCGYGAES